MCIMALSLLWRERLVKKVVAVLLTACLLCPVCYAAEAPSVSAASAILVDAHTGRVLYEKDAYSKRLIASTTKLMTALVAVESTPDLQRMITVRPEYQAEGSSIYLAVGEEITLEALLYGLLLHSGNDAALAIAGGCAGDVETFVGWMNQWAGEIGMTNTHFANPNGLDDEEHYSTAWDMTLLAREVLGNDILREMVSTKSIHIGERDLTNHNKLLWRYEGCGGMKTGYTMAAGRTLVSCATRGGQTLICVTLDDPNDWEDHEALFDYGFQNWSLHPLAHGGKVVRALPVTGSLLPQVAVVTDGDVRYPLGTDERVMATISLPKQVAAPVKEGAIAGKITFTLSEQVIGETYLLYAADVPANAAEPTLFQRVREFLRGEGVAGGLAVFARKVG